MSAGRGEVTSPLHWKYILIMGYPRIKNASRSWMFVAASSCAHTEIYPYLEIGICSLEFDICSLNIFFAFNNMRMQILYVNTWE